MNHYMDVSSVIPDDPKFTQLWGIKRIQAVPAWTIGHDCSQTVVAVIDTGMDLTHEDLVGNIWINSGEITGNGVDDDGNGFIDDVNGWNFYDSTNDPQDDHFHGTHVSGIIGAVADNGRGVAGVCWKARIMVVKVLGPDGSGAMSDVASGISYAVANGAKVLNLSLGAPGNSAAVESAIQAAQAADVLLAVAAGNNGDDLGSDPVYPAANTEDNLIRVAAVDSTDNLASFSNFGVSVDIGAPGVGILSSLPTHVTDAMAEEELHSLYDNLDGTSMATPYVAGSAALVWSQHLDWNYSQVKAWLLNNADQVSAITVSNNRRLKLGTGI